jgi:phage baseplate assembly protein W
MAIEFYKDLPLDFTPHPVSGDVRPIVNEVAVKRAISNLINTKRGSKPFRPEYGTKIRDYLFDSQDIFTENEIKKHLKETIEKFEPRVSVRNIKVDFVDLGFKIQIDLIIANVNQLIQVPLTISRTA